MTNEFIKMIKERRSVRRFTKDSVDKEVIHEIIQAGRYAPSAENSQPWKFIVITNTKEIQQLSRRIKVELQNLIKRRWIARFSIKELKDEDTLRFLYAVSSTEEDTIFFHAPVLLFIITKNRLMYDESCACCAQNMMLAAHSLGIGSCWIGFASVLGLSQDMLKNIGVPEGYHISAALVFGHPQGKPKRASIRKIESDVINWIE
jgi:nitroreductase